MRKNVSVLVGVILFVTILAGASVLVALTEAPDEIAIHSDSFEKAKKPHKYGPTPYSHKKHNVDYQLACTECHHVYEGGKNIWKEEDPVQKCEACHDPIKSVGNQKKLMLAFHKNCQGCHKDLEKAGKPTGPTTCKDCHTKKE